MQAAKPKKKKKAASSDTDEEEADSDVTEENWAPKVRPDMNVTKRGCNENAHQHLFGGLFSAVSSLTRDPLTRPLDLPANCHCKQMACCIGCCLETTNKFLPAGQGSSEEACCQA